MTSIDTMINRATFELVAAKRQKFVAARRACDAAEDACTCERRCSRECPARAARATLDEIGAEVIAAEASWRAWHAGA